MFYEAGFCRFQFIFGCFACLLASLGHAAQDPFSTRTRSELVSAGSSIEGCAVLPLSGQTGVLMASLEERKLVQILNKIAPGKRIGRADGSTAVPLISFGGERGATPLYTNQKYRFRAYAGDVFWKKDAHWSKNLDYSYQNGEHALGQPIVRIIAFDKRALKTSSVDSKPKLSTIALPQEGTPEWYELISKSGVVTLNADGLLTTIRIAHGEGGRYWLELSHIAESSRYAYSVELLGVHSVEEEDSNAYLPLTVREIKQGSVLVHYPDYTPLYTLSFQERPAWSTTFVRVLSEEDSYVVRSHSETPPEPPKLNSLSLEEGLRLNHVPELYRDSELDNLLTMLDGDPLRAVEYVFNETMVTDALVYDDQGIEAFAEYKVGSLARSAADVYKEKQGSPLELCALTVYLLRALGVPAWYIFPKDQGLKVETDRLSKILGLKAKPLYRGGEPLECSQTTEVFYPGVLAYIEGKFQYIFPWLKQVEFVEKQHLFDLLPEEGARGRDWVEGYILNRVDISESSVSVWDAYESFLKNTLAASGKSLRDCGLDTWPQKRYYYRWDRLPKPAGFPDSFEIKDSIGKSFYETLRLDVVLDDGDGPITLGTWPLAELTERNLTFSWKETAQVPTFIVHLAAREAVSRPSVMATSTYEELTEEERSSAINWVFPLKETATSAKLQFHYGRPVQGSESTVCELFESRELQSGEFASLCINLGSVTPLMLQKEVDAFNAAGEFLAQAGQDLSADVLITTSTSLLGMEYFERMTRFEKAMLPLHHGTRSSLRAFALAKMRPVSRSGGLSLVPILDVFHLKLGLLNECANFASTSGYWDARSDYWALYAAEASLSEQWAINHLFSQTDAVSSVDVLRTLEFYKGEESPGVLVLDKHNIRSAGDQLVNGVPLRMHSPKLWSHVEYLLRDDTIESAGTRVIITPGKVQLGAFSGVAAFVMMPNSAEALLEHEHGGLGAPINAEWASPSAAGGILKAVLDGDNGVSIQVTPKSDTLNSKSLSESRSYMSDPIAQSLLRRDPVEIAKAFVHPRSSSVAIVPHPSSGEIPYVHRGVHLQRGSFEYAAEDLTLNGILPLTVKRTYSSSFLGDGLLGYGWQVWFLEGPRLSREAKHLFVTVPDQGVLVLEQDKGGIYRAYPSSRQAISTEPSTEVLSLNLQDSSPELLLKSGHRLIFDHVASGIRLKQWQDEQGNAFDFYYRDGRLERLESTDGRILKVLYNRSGRVSGFASGDGRMVQYTYSAEGDLIACTHADGSVETYAYREGYHFSAESEVIASGHLLEACTDPVGRSRKIVYGLWNRVESQYIQGSDGASTSDHFNYIYEDDSWGSNSGKTSVYAMIGLEGVYAYQDGYMISFENALGQVTEQAWESQECLNGQVYAVLHSIKDMQGLVRRFTYDEQGQCVSVQFEGDLRGVGSEDVAKYTYEYDDQGLVVRVVEPLGAEVLLSYEDEDYPQKPTLIEKRVNGEIISQRTLAYGDIIENTSRVYGVLLSEKTSGGPHSPDTLVTWLYDAHGYPQEVTLYTGNEAPSLTYTYDYNPRGECVLKREPSGAETRLDYNASGQLEARQVYSVSGKLLSDEVFHYNRSGDLIFSSNLAHEPHSYVHYDYESTGRLSRKVVSHVSPSLTSLDLVAEEPHVWHYTYDIKGNLSELIDPRGGRRISRYDASGRVVGTSVFEAESAVLLAQESYIYGQGDLPVIHQTSLGGKEVFSYTSEGRIAQAKDAAGRVTLYSYDLIGRILEERIQGGMTTRYIYQDEDRSVRIEWVDGDNVLSERFINYDWHDNIIAWTDEWGHRFSIKYDGLGRMIHWEGPESTQAPQSKQQWADFSYDTASQSVEKRTDRTRITQRYDALGRLTYISHHDLPSNALAFEKKVDYDAGGSRVTTKIGSGASALEYVNYCDASGNVLIDDHGEGIVYRYSFDESGRPLFEQNPAGLSTHYRYDALGRIQEKVLPSGSHVRFEYLNGGNRMELILSDKLKYISVRDISGNIVYEGLQSPQGVTQEASYAYYMHGPHAGRLQRSTYLDGTQVEYTYDAWANPISLKAYTADAELSETIDYTYDFCGRMTRASSTGHVWSKSTVVERAYDAYGQLVLEEVFLDGKKHASWTQAWDAEGMRTALITGRHTWCYDYNSVQLLTRIDDSWGRIYRFEYDDAARLSKRITPWRTQTLTYAHKHRRPTLLETVADEKPLLMQKVAYRLDQKVERVDIIFEGDQQLNQQSLFSYDSGGAILSEYHKNFGRVRTVDYERGSALDGHMRVRRPLYWELASDFDDYSRVTSLSYEHGNRRFKAWGAAPGANRLEGFLNDDTISSIHFDPHNSEGLWYVDLDLPMGEHNLRMNAYTNEDREAMLTAESHFSVEGQRGVAQLKYDPRGNIIRKEFSDGSVQRFIWDAWGHLVGVQSELASEGNSISGFTWKASYDPLGRLICSSYENNASRSDGPLEVCSFYDPEVEFLEIGTQFHDKTVWRVYGPDLAHSFGPLQGIGGIEAIITEEGSARGVLQDVFGNAVAMVDKLGVHPHGVYVSGYGPEPTEAPSIFPWESDWSKLLAWRGQRQDLCGYYRLGARFYDHTLGRFLSPDPKGHSAGLDLYAYVHGHPINAIDPTGRDAYILDGTWADETGMRDAPALTNSQRLYQAYTGPGESHYYRGVGNKQDNSWFAQYWGGATGAGSKDIVESIYDDIVFNYNNGDTHIALVGWSRGAAGVMQVLWELYKRGVPNLIEGGHIIAPFTECPFVDQIHLMDTVHSMGVPGNNINHGWDDKDLPPNVRRSYHYLATDPPSFGFDQTRLRSAQEKAYCGGHGDVGGSVDTPCRRWVYRSIIENANSHGLMLFDPETIDEDSAPLR